jgi:biotin transport system permease protein
MIGGYATRRAWLHRVPAGGKLITLMAGSLALLSVNDLRVLLVVLTLIGAVYVQFGRDGWLRLRSLRPLVLLLAIVGAFQAYATNWEDGVALVMRLLAMILLADLVTMTTTMSALMDAMAPVLRAVCPRSVNHRKISLAIALVLRFVPVLLARWQARQEAWQARTNRRVPPRLVAAFVAETLQLADHVAEALDARGFDASPTSRS